MEIERVLTAHPAVAESAVIPVPAALSEDDIHAYVVYGLAPRPRRRSCRRGVRRVWPASKFHRVFAFVTHSLKPRHNGWKNTSCVRSMPVACRTSPPMCAMLTLDTDGVSHVVDNGALATGTLWIVSQGGCCINPQIYGAQHRRRDRSKTRTHGR